VSQPGKAMRLRHPPCAPLPTRPTSRVALR
jgi:hypothetical protein